MELLDKRFKNTFEVNDAIAITLYFSWTKLFLNYSKICLNINEKF